MLFLASRQEYRQISKDISQLTRTPRMPMPKKAFRPVGVINADKVIKMLSPRDTINKYSDIFFNLNKFMAAIMSIIETTMTPKTD
jgi:hypothetical protein